MKTYLAPMEGITGYIFRNAHSRFYGKMDKYFAPFMSPADNCPMTTREKRDILPQNNPGLYVVPQILTARAEHFILAAEKLKEMGYSEVNLNLGCPSGTVCTKGKGAGFLRDPEGLHSFLEEIYGYGEREKIAISVKTRTGFQEEEEWPKLLEIYNDFPIHELIVHPRLAVDYYNGEPRAAQYAYTLQHSKNPVVYNGNLFTIQDIRDHESEDAVMLGRGLCFRPQLLEEAGILMGDTAEEKRFWKFHDQIYHEYQKIMTPDINALHRMKELWTYWSRLFPGEERTIKAIHKSKRYADYEAAVRPLRRF